MPGTVQFSQPDTHSSVEGAPKRAKAKYVQKTLIHHPYDMCFTLAFHDFFVVSCTSSSLFPQLH